MKSSAKPILSVTIKDCEIQTFRAGGKGGQNQNKKDSGVRIIHHPSGARGESREARGQLENKRNAFVRMGTSPKFNAWARIQALGLAKELDEQVDREMHPNNLTIEYGI